jgi:hypothetical protein
MVNAEMIGIDSVVGAAQSATPVGIVLLQAIVLYVGYGGLERLVGPKIAAAIEHE